MISKYIFSDIYNQIELLYRQEINISINTQYDIKFKQIKANMSQKQVLIAIAK